MREQCDAVALSASTMSIKPTTFISSIGTYNPLPFVLIFFIIISMVEKYHRNCQTSMNTSKWYKKIRINFGTSNFNGRYENNEAFNTIFVEIMYRPVIWIETEDLQDCCQMREKPSLIINYRNKYRFSEFRCQIYFKRTMN